MRICFCFLPIKIFFLKNQLNHVSGEITTSCYYNLHGVILGCFKTGLFSISWSSDLTLKKRKRKKEEKKKEKKRKRKGKKESKTKTKKQEITITWSNIIFVYLSTQTESCLRVLCPQTFTSWQLLMVVFKIGLFSMPLSSDLKLNNKIKDEKKRIREKTGNKKREKKNNERKTIYMQA